jgi:voltage-gated potassium channel
MAKRLEIPILVATLLVVPIIAIEESNVSAAWKTFGEVLNWCVWVAFVAEAGAMLAVVPSKKRWLREHPLEIAVIVLTPPWFPPGLQAVRIFRLLRLLRLFRVASLARRLFSLEGLRYVSLLAVMTVFAGGSAFAVVEDKESTWDGIWWAFTTMTTVGYGDIRPTTTLGRLIAMVVMLVGIGFVAILTAAVAQRFLAPQLDEISQREVEVAADIEAAETDVLAEVRTIRARLERLESLLERQSS